MDLSNNFIENIIIYPNIMYQFQIYKYNQVYKVEA